MFSYCFTKLLHEEVETMEYSIMLYSPEFPCWDAETVAAVGDDPTVLDDLADAEAIAPLGGGWVLTPKGEALRQDLSAELGVPSSPVTEFLTDEDEAHEALEHNRLCVLMDRAFKTQWGIKDVTYREHFPFVPSLRDNEYFAIEGDRARALWPDHPLIRAFKETFPYTGVAARGRPVPGQRALDAWAARVNAPKGVLTVDFMLRSRYDFAYYQQFKPLPDDIFHFCNTDLLYVFKCPKDLMDLLPLIGKLHIFTLLQRRIYVPGYYDIDMQEQEEWTMMCIVTDSEDELTTANDTLRSWGRDLIDPCCPMFIVGTSIERLRAQKAIKDTIYDWFAEETVHILRPDAE